MTHLDEDRIRWAEALAVERLHGDDAPVWIAERIGALAHTGDAAGVQRTLALAERLERILQARRSQPGANDADDSD